MANDSLPQQSGKLVAYGYKWRWVWVTGAWCVCKLDYRYSCLLARAVYGSVTLALHWFMPISCHFRDSKVLLVIESDSHKQATWIFALPFTFKGHSYLVFLAGRQTGISFLWGHHWQYNGLMSHKSHHIYSGVTMASVWLGDVLCSSQTTEWWSNKQS